MIKHTLSILAALLISTNQVQATVRFSIIDLGKPDALSVPVGSSLDGVEAFSINDAGQIAGVTLFGGIGGPDTYRAFLYGSGNFNDIGTLGGPNSIAYGVNNAGQVTGQASLPTGSPLLGKAFLYSEGIIQEILIPDAISSVGRGISDFGHITGDMSTIDGRRGAFLYSDSSVIDLGTLGGDMETIGMAVNNSGQVTGWSSLSNGDTRAFLYRDNEMIDLGTLGGIWSQGYAINSAAQVAGLSLTENDEGRAFIYNDGLMTDLGTLAGMSFSEARGINDAGQVVGSSCCRIGDSPRAFLYSDGEMTDLNSLIDPLSGWTLWGAYDINNAGQIVGFGTKDGPTGNVRTFLLTPLAGNPAPPVGSIPEPKVWTTLIVGFGIVGAIKRRRKSPAFL